MKSLNRLLLLGALWPAAVATSLAAAEERPPDIAPANTVAGILKQHCERYPKLSVEDAYKLVFQACLGSEHAVANPEDARRWLEQELATLGSGPDEPLIDPISPDGRIVRVHLRPFAAQKGNPERLLQAFIQTANHYRGSRKELARSWAEVVRLAVENALPFSADEARAFGTKMADAGYPAVHHSKIYTVEYRPAYRVIAREYLDGISPEWRKAPDSSPVDNSPR